MVLLVVFVSVIVVDVMLAAVSAIGIELLVHGCGGSKDEVDTRYARLPKRSTVKEDMKLK